MKHIMIFLTLSFASQGCKDSEQTRHSQNGNSKQEIKISEHLAKEGEVVFTDAFRNTYPMEGAHIGCLFRFREDGTVLFSSFAYDLPVYHGFFHEEGGEINISLHVGGVAFQDGRTDPDVVSLPPLKLQDTPEGLTLIRADGRTDFKEHWNIYPWAIEQVFPFRIATPEFVEHDGTGKPVTRSESDSEDGYKPQPESKVHSR